MLGFDRELMASCRFSALSVPSRRSRAVLVVVLAAAGLLLFCSAVPGVFTIDEANYLVTVLGLRQGTFAVPGTAELPPSMELEYFDPVPHTPGGRGLPLTSTAPPLYSFFAYPFSFAGWRGLIALNILSYLLTAALVFLYCARFSRSERTPWVALAVFTLCSFTVEYAQGVWPHMLAVGLCTSAFVAASRARSSAAPWYAGVAGLLAGLAAGVRYQNIAFAGFVGFGLIVWCRRRWLMSSLYAAGAALPAAATTIINHHRLGSWNPFNKGPGYLSVGDVAGGTGSLVSRALHVVSIGLQSTWGRVVDRSAWPAAGEPGSEIARLLPKDPHSGAFLVLGVVKKAWAQSCPWILLVLVVLVLAWFTRLRWTQGRTTEVRAAAIVVFGVLGSFALFGYRTEGWAFNQRYLLELTPLASVILAWVTERLQLGSVWVAIGAAGAAGAVVALLQMPPEGLTRQEWMLKLPVVLGLGLAAAAILSLKLPRLVVPVSLLLGACLAWSAAVHLGVDLYASREHRIRHHRQQEALARVLPSAPAAVFAYWGAKDSIAPLQIDHDLVVADPWIDRGKDAPALTRAFEKAGRRVFVITEGMPRPILQSLTKGHRLRFVAGPPWPILELD